MRSNVAALLQRLPCDFYQRPNFDDACGPRWNSLGDGDRCVKILDVDEQHVFHLFLYK
jgi:hypothetical protein